MRWEDVLSDVAGQLDAGLALDLAAEVADRTRRESASLLLRDRVAGSCGSRLEVLTRAGAWEGRVARVGADWLLLGDAQGALEREVLIPLAGVQRVHGLGRRTTAAGHLAQRMDLGHALRGLARDRLPVVLVLDGGDRLRCRVDRVGRDFLDAVEPDAPGRPPVTVALAALVAVLRAP